MKEIKNKPTSSPVSVVALCLALLLIFGFAAGCGGRKAAKPEMVTFHFNPSENTNNGQPVYIVIKKANPKEFLVEDYEQITGTVYSDPPDVNLLAWQLLMPGKKEEVKVEKPDSSAVSVYALFTEPGVKWKTILNSPFESKYKFILERNTLDCKDTGD